VPIRRLLETTELFATLPAVALATLAEQAELRHYARNQVLFRHGDPATELFVVDRGRIAVAQRSGDGRESVVAVLEGGSLVGEMPLFDDAPRSADARALTDSDVVALGYEPVRAVLRAQPEVLWVIVRLLAARLRETNEALADAVFLDVPARTAKRVLELAGDRERFSLPVTQEELAAMVGASRERVNKALSLFLRLGWLSLEGRNRYRILDRQALEDRATL